MSFNRPRTRESLLQTPTPPGRAGRWATRRRSSGAAIALVLVAGLVSAPPAAASITVNRMVTAPAIGTPQANCTGLRELLAGLTATAAEPYLVRLEPGVYDCGDTAVSLPEFVHLEGSGRGVSLLLFDFDHFSTGLSIHTGSEARHLTVELLTNGCAVAQFGATSRLTHVDIHVGGSGAGSTLCGVFVGNGVFSILEDVSIEIGDLGGGLNHSGLNVLLASGRLDRVRVKLVGDSSSSVYGVWIHPSSPGSLLEWEIRDSAVDVSGGGSATGIYARDVAPILYDTTVRAADGDTATYAVDLDGASAWIAGSTLEATDAGVGGEVRSLHASATGGVTPTVEIHDSRLLGDAGTILGDAEYTISVGLSLLSGGPVIPNGGTATCAVVWDESGTFFSNTCP